MVQFVDKYSERILGSATLEKSIDHLVEKLRLDRFQDVHTEDVLAVRWKRQGEVARLIKPGVPPAQDPGTGRLREEVQVYLKLEPGDPEQVVSRNIVADWMGTKYPKEVGGVFECVELTAGRAAQL
ncbi:hypothetical protein IscW_ISCW001343 [Ixodes scapularis]|uniref:Uncharacterized protein n=1 Tax=Ixodes scapularis TaxID=6945 RepID=B7P582_IXOSC|nr:hypothetical protein IscW_ISCW001343 [Ixodes scapularis]|eukprot:XP_002407148.1 hypothetical protein IscW_ISCW001343 [Ixodes scapularis]